MEMKVQYAIQLIVSTSIKMKKILYIITSLDSGGEEKFLLDIYPLLTNKLKHIICPLIHAGKFYPNNQSVKLENGKNNRFWLWLFKSQTVPAKMLKPLFWIYYVARIDRILKNENPDAIVTCTPDSSFSLCMHEIITFSRRKKYTWYYRVGTHFYPTGYVPSLFRNNMTCLLMIKLMTKIGSFLVKLRIKRANQFIVVNSILKQELINAYHINVKNIFTLPVSLSNTNINLQPYLTKNFLFPQNSNKKYFVAAGRLKYVKGFDFLIGAIEPILKEQHDIILVIAGEGPEKSRLLKQIQLLGLTEKIILPGFIHDPTTLIHDPIAYIVPSRSEGFGKLIIEAMNTRSIVIASNCAGPNEIIENDTDGLLFQKENELSLINAIKKTLSMSDEHRLHIKENAYKKSLHFTSEQITLQLNKKLESDLCQKESF